MIFVYIKHSRSFGEDINMTNPKVKLPALLIMGERDYLRPNCVKDVKRAFRSFVLVLLK